MNLSEVGTYLDKACEKFAQRSFGEAEGMANAAAEKLNTTVGPAHFHLLETYPPFMKDDPGRDLMMLSSRISHIISLVRQAEAEGNRFSHDYMALMVASQQLYDTTLASPRNQDPKRLMAYGSKLFSQSDEDGLIAEVFKRIGIKSQTFVEFGVQSGTESNTAKLLVEGWRGLWIECSKNYVETILAFFRQFIALGKLQVMHSFVTAENINDLLRNSGLPADIDLISIDIDGNDYWVWKAITAMQPRVVMIEYNATYAPPLTNVCPYVPDQIYGGTNYFGASLGALAKLGTSKGYNLVGCSFRGNNAIFVREDLCGDKFKAPFTAEEHFEPIRYAAIAPWGYLSDFGPFEFV